MNLFQPHLHRSTWSAPTRTSSRTAPLHCSTEQLLCVCPRNILCEKLLNSPRFEYAREKYWKPQASQLPFATHPFHYLFPSLQGRRRHAPTSRCRRNFKARTWRCRSGVSAGCVFERHGEPLGKGHTLEGREVLLYFAQSVAFQTSLGCNAR